MDMPSQTPDTGTAYGRRPGQHDAELTEVGPGTPMGELLRRYWHPIATTEQVNQDLPLRLRILGEDLIAFRDGQGRPGLLAEKCCHRGTSLFYGRIEDDGLRCCYHGWKFDPQGHCLDQACEPGGGAKREAARQPWYPVQERYGLVFAYMGPPEKKPVLPRWDVLENLEPDEFIELMLNPGYGEGEILPFNWLQSYENALDPLHVAWLHQEHSEEVQFGYKRVINNTVDTHEVIKAVNWGETPMGARYTRTTPIGDTGNAAFFTVEAIVPTIFCVPNPVDQQKRLKRHDHIGWHTPVDDHHFKLFQAARVHKAGELTSRVALHKGKKWSECTPDELQRYPGDYEAQVSQGAITSHSDETLALSDRGIILLRRKLRKQVQDLAAGKDPINLVYDENAAPVATVAGLTVGPL